MKEKLDVVIFGASGFTGKNTVKQLNTIVKQRQTPLKWGIAGRSEHKLKQILEDLKVKTGDDFSNVKIIIADGNDNESLKKMTEQAKIIFNCCGPYIFFGESVVKACIETRTHHVDVSAEPQFKEKIQLEYHKAAQEKGIYIVSACGFGSVPADLGIVYLQQIFDGTVNDVETYFEMQIDKKISGPLIHFGTWESILYYLANLNEIRLLRRKLYPERLPQFRPKQSSRFYLHKCPIDRSKWAFPFLGPDKFVIQRTQRHFFHHDKKRPARVRCWFILPSFLEGLLMGFFGLIFLILSKFSCGRYLVLKYPKAFSGGWVSHEGPSDEKMESTNFSVTVVGKGWSKDKVPTEPTDKHTDPPNKTTIVKVSGTNIAYGATCIMLVLCGLTILEEADKMPDNGGVYTPGAAFANTSLIQQLHKHGVTFQHVSSKQD